MLTPLEQDVYTPLAYFAYFGYPLTAFEIWKWQFEPNQVRSLDEIQHILEKSAWLTQRVSSHNGFYAVGDDQAVRAQMHQRHVRYLDAIEKEQKLKHFLLYLRRLPDVRGAALCNSMPFHFTHEQGDIDVFIVTKPGRVWSARLSAVAPLIALRQRPGEARQHPIDLSFFVSESDMDLFGLQKSHDPYFAYWIATLTPVLGSQALWYRFFEQNQWAFSRLPNAQPPKRAFRFGRKEMQPLLPRMSEEVAKQIQLKRLPVDLQKVANTSSQVVMNRQMLKFHRTDRREEIAQAFDKQMAVCQG